jgi:hypothetical protein
MEFQSKQTTPGIAWINGQPFKLGPGEATPAKGAPQDHASTDLHIQDPPGDDHTPAARARKAKRRLRRLFEHVRRNAKGQARLCRADEYEILRCAYRFVRLWRSDGVHEEIERELRVGAEVAVCRRSSLFLLLIRCALPHLDIKRASKWAVALEYADEQGIPSKRLDAFLWSVGGVEGAARARAKFRRETSERDANLARSPNAV